MIPRRVQRKRTKGWRMPPNTVSVCRPGKWGNPFPVSDKIPADLAVVLFEDYLHGEARVMRGEFSIFAMTYAEENGGFPQQPRLITPEDVRKELRGKNLACFCPLDQPCHADVLLRIANGPEYPCTECGGDAFVGYASNKKSAWGGLVKKGERICTRCFQRRGGNNFFGRKK